MKADYLDDCREEDCPVCGLTLAHVVGVIFSWVGLTSLSGLFVALMVGDFHFAFFCFLTFMIAMGIIILKVDFVD